ncbi:MAG: flavin reductase family protein [Clostridia bacterium]
MEIVISEIDRQSKYKLLIGSVLPRPIAWITSVNENGIVNAAPFSYFNVACIEPMMISVSIMRKPGGMMKDTARNIEQTRDFVINMVDVHNVEAVNQSSADYPPEQSEVDEIGLTKLPSQQVRAPRLAEARIHYECRLHQIVSLGEPASADLIIAEVVHVQVADELYHDGKIDVQKLAPVSRLAGHSYATLGEVFDRPRPVYQPK